MSKPVNSTNDRGLYYYTTKCEKCGGKESGRTTNKEAAKAWDGATTKCEACVIRDAGY